MNEVRERRQRGKAATVLSLTLIETWGVIIRLCATSFYNSYVFIEHIDTTAE